MSTESPETVVDPELLQDQEFALKWARAVRWAAENLSAPHRGKGAMNAKKAGSELNFSVWKVGKDNGSAFMQNMVPRALQILDKHSGSTVGDEELAKAEEAPIAELEDLLKRYVEASQCVAT